MQLEGKGRNRQASPRIGVVLGNMGSGSHQQRPWWPASALGMPVARGPSPAALPGSPKATYSPLAYLKRQHGSSTEPEDAEEDADDNELNDLLHLALCKTPSSDSDATANNTNMDTSGLELGKSQTSESATFNNLLSTLHGSYQVGLQHHAEPLACTDLLACTGMGVGEYGIRLPGNIVPQPSIVAMDSESDDVPLVSKRAVGSRTPNTFDVVSDGAVVATSPYTPLLTSSIERRQQQEGSPVLAGVGMSSFGVFADAAVGSGFGLISSSPMSCFRPHPAWLSEASRLLYVAVFLTQESRDVLLAMVPPLHPLVRADHMTLAYKPLSVQQLLSFPLGASVQLNIIGSVADSRTQAVVADPPPWLPPTASVSTHVTISIAIGAKAVEAGHLVKDALHRAATADPAGPVVSGAGTYVAFEEPLQLVGRLGVSLALPSGQDVVVYGVEELAAGGHISICSDNIDTFYSMHSERVKRPLQQQPSPTSCLDLPSATASASSSTGGGAITGPYSPLTAAAVPDDMPPLQLPPALQLPPPLINTPLDASNSNSCWSPGSAAAADSGSSITTATEQPVVFPLMSPAADESAEQQLNNNADDDTSSSSGSDSDVDAVQFRSAVQVGDYVVLRPFVPKGSGDVLQQGYVREFACEEAFQGNGVMVVLTDNTIGFVVAVLDPAGSSSSGKAGSSSKRAAAQQPKTSKLNKRNKQKAGRKKAASAGGNLAALDAAALDSADVLSEWALSQHDAAPGDVAATAAAGLGVRNAADAAADMQLWAEFDALQRQHGEELCGAILRSCDHDFVEAIALIKAQAAGFGSSSTGAAVIATPAAAAVPAAAAQQPAAAAAAAGPDEDLVVQLALSLGLPAESALALCRLVPHVAPEAAVEALQQHSGDANKAADALLAAEAEAESAAAAAAIAAGEPAAYGITSSSRGTQLSPADRVAAAFARARDPDLVVAARRLCGMFAGLQQDVAEMMLQEHGGSIEQAASAISDMQAKEMQARTAAAAADAASSPSVMHSGSCNLQQQPQQQELSEEDQLAMLVAMGELNPTEQQQQISSEEQQQLLALAKNRGSSATQRQQRSPPRTPHPRSPMLASTQHQQQYSSDQQTSYTPLHTNNRQPPPPPPQQQQQGVYGLPGRYSSMQQQQGNHGDQEAKLAAKAAADKLYKKSRALSNGATVLMTAASAYLAEENITAYREQKAAADRLRTESLAAFEEAQRLSWSANNKAQQTWQVDLHGLGTSVALRKFVGQFTGLEAMASGHPGGVLYQVITGKGKHSEDNVPKIKLGVLQYLQERGEAVMEQSGRPWGVTWQVDPCNEGVVNVYIPGCSEEEGEEGGSSSSP